MITKSDKQSLKPWLHQLLRTNISIGDEKEELTPLEIFKKLKDILTITLYYEWDDIKVLNLEDLYGYVDEQTIKNEFSIKNIYSYFNDLKKYTEKWDEDYISLDCLNNHFELYGGSNQPRNDLIRSNKSIDEIKEITNKYKTNHTKNLLSDLLKYYKLIRTINNKQNTRLTDIYAFKRVYDNKSTIYTEIIENCILIFNNVNNDILKNNKHLLLNSLKNDVKRMDKLKCVDLPDNMIDSYVPNPFVIIAKELCDHNLYKDDHRLFKTENARKLLETNKKKFEELGYVYEGQYLNTHLILHDYKVFLKKVYKEKLENLKLVSKSYILNVPFMDELLTIFKNSFNYSYIDHDMFISYLKKEFLTNIIHIKFKNEFKNEFKDNFDDKFDKLLMDDICKYLNDIGNERCDLISYMCKKINYYQRILNSENKWYLTIKDEINKRTIHTANPELNNIFIEKSKQNILNNVIMLIKKYDKLDYSNICTRINSNSKKIINTTYDEIINNFEETIKTTIKKVVENINIPELTKYCTCIIEFLTSKEKYKKQYNNLDDVEVVNKLCINYDNSLKMLKERNTLYLKTYNNRLNNDELFLININKDNTYDNVNRVCILITNINCIKKFIMSTFKDTSHDKLLTNIKNYKKTLTNFIKDNDEYNAFIKKMEEKYSNVTLDNERHIKGHNCLIEYFKEKRFNWKEDNYIILKKCGDLTNLTSNIKYYYPKLKLLYNMTKDEYIKNKKMLDSLAISSRIYFERTDSKNAHIALYDATKFKCINKIKFFKLIYISRLMNTGITLNTDTSINYFTYSKSIIKREFLHTRFIWYYFAQFREYFKLKKQELVLTIPKKWFNKNMKGKCLRTSPINILDGIFCHQQMSGKGCKYATCNPNKKKRKRKKNLKYTFKFIDL